jgi:mono/diheme cytochrome c family protein
VVDVQVANFTFTGDVAVERATPEGFWEQYTAACAQEDKQVAAADRARQEHVLVARVAALMQVLAPEPPALRLGLVKYLAAVSHAEATRALARLAVFSEEDDVRLAAVEAIKVRRERDYTDVLLGSLRYPWPAVAKRGADALARLERTDLVPQLVELLDQPDPRAPVAREAGGRRVHEARELVRVNHHRNCLLCHAPGNSAGVSPETLTAAVPVPSEPLPATPDGYQVSSPDLSVRIDVTYLRPDFSALQPVTDAHPWPEMQRYDFLVRTRALTEDEAAALRETLASGDPGRPSPYHRAALAALRELTGRDAAPTAEAWRRLLNLPAGARPAAP